MSCGITQCHFRRVPELSQSAPRASARSRQRSRRSPRTSPSSTPASSASRLLGDYFPAFPHVKWSSIHARCLARVFGRTPQRAPNTRRKVLRPTRADSPPRRHEFLSSNSGVRPELSYTTHSSAKGRYTRSKLSQLLENLRSRSRRATSWPPCLTRAATRRAAN